VTNRFITSIAYRFIYHKRYATADCGDNVERHDEMKPLSRMEMACLAGSLTPSPGRCRNNGKNASLAGIFARV